MRIRTFAALAAFVLLLARPLSATWSIILINVRTGEIAIGSATCVAGFDLQSLLPIVMPGVGAGAPNQDSSGPSSPRGTYAPTTSSPIRIVEAVGGGLKRSPASGIARAHRKRRSSASSISSAEAAGGAPGSL